MIKKHGNEWAESTFHWAYLIYFETKTFATCHTNRKYINKNNVQILYMLKICAVNKDTSAALERQTEISISVDILELLFSRLVKTHTTIIY